MSQNRNQGTLSAVLLVVITIILVLTPGAWAQNKYKILHKFSDGEYLVNGLVFDRSGSLYGTAPDGGAYGYGIVFVETDESDDDSGSSVKVPTDDYRAIRRAILDLSEFENRPKVGSATPPQH
jgi:hypothetical protein